jgi:hypothetical protein
MTYFSAMLQMVCLVKDRRLRNHICDYPLFIIRADDQFHAFEQALAIGKTQEHEYSNHQGQPVRWVFAKVETIKRLGKKIDGLEVGSFLDVLRTKAPIPFNKHFYPHKHKPSYDND